MFGGIGSKRGIVAKKGVSGDFIPNAIQWGTFDGSIYSMLYVDCDDYAFSERQITGIDQTITLKITLSCAPQCANSLFVKVSSSSGAVGNGDGSTKNTPQSFGCTELFHNSTFTVSNNQYITFVSNQAQFTFFVYNASNSDSLLSEISITSVFC